MAEDFLVQSGVSLGRLANLAKVIEAGGVAAAARLDGPNQDNQSLYSKQLADLERAFGKSLFLKDGRGRKPTLVAKQLASAYTAFADSVSELLRDASGQEAFIRIGAGDSVFKWLFLPVMSVLEGKFPSVSFDLLNLRTRTVVEQVQSGEIDLGIAEIREQPDGVDARELRRMEFGLYHCLDTKRKADAKSVLQRGKLIGLGGSGSYVRNCHEQQRRHNLPERLWLTFDSLPMVADSMVQSQGAAFLPLEMKDELGEAGFACIQDASMDGFSRSYKLLTSKYTSRIRSKVSEVAEALREEIA